MYTLEQLTKALPTLEESFRTIDDFISVSIKHVCGGHSYYTDGEAREALAILTFGRKNPNHVPGVIDLANPAVDYGSMYIFPNGRMISHFMKYKGYTTTSEYVKCIGIWLATLV
jgi:hypothetical protein